MAHGWEFLLLTPERIKAARLGLGLSQPEFAEWIRRRGRLLAPPTKSAVSRWERGVRRPDKIYGPLILAAEREARRGDGGSGTPDN